MDKRLSLRPSRLAFPDQGRACRSRLRILLLDGVVGFKCFHRLLAEGGAGGARRTRLMWRSSSKRSSWRRLDNLSAPTLRRVWRISFCR